jgi:rhamnogalacturonan endolyase
MYCLVLTLSGSSQPVQKKVSNDSLFRIEKLLFQDDFASLDTNKWRIEKTASDSEIVTTKNNRLLIDTYGGATIFYTRELSGNVYISYKRTVLINKGKNDRLSDLNQFFMVREVKTDRLSKRNGGFAEYDSLNMYYVGMGGNYNTTTRFRKYENGNKKIIAEYTDAAHLLQANHEYLIEIIFLNGTIIYKVDGNIFFEWKDNNPYTKGYFAIRSTRSRQEINDLKIYSIQTRIQ